jgi:hypothetical protein
MRQKKRTFALSVAAVLLVPAGWYPEARAQLEPITTTILCNTAATCAAAGLPNVNAATLRRPATDVLGRAHVGIEITHDSSSYGNFSACTQLAQRGFTTLCADGPFGNSVIADKFAYYGLEQIVPTVASAINYLRTSVTGPAIDTVVILVNIRGVGKHPNGNNMTTPLLIDANSGHYFLRLDEMIYDNATATLDKTYAIEEGSVHGGTECTACESLLGLPAGYFGDTLGRTMNFMAEWLAARF